MSSKENSNLSNCLECDGETYWFELNGKKGIKCKKCDFTQIEKSFTPEEEINIRKALRSLYEC